MRSRPAESLPEPDGTDGSSKLERSLIHRVVDSDDHRAFEELVRTHQSPIRQFLRRLTGQDLERADDLAQEVFFKAYRYLSSYRGDGRFRSWLFSIAYQLFVTDERRYKKVDFAPLDVEPVAQKIEGDVVVLSRTVSTMLDCLRDEERSAILLCYQHELTHEEVATVMELPLGTVKSLVRRGRMKMKQIHESTKDGRRS